MTALLNMFQYSSPEDRQTLDQNLTEFIALKQEVYANDRRFIGRHSVDYRVGGAHYYQPFSTQLPD